MRLKKEEVATREKFLTEILKENPKLTIRGAQELIKGKFGKQMRPHRILEIKDEVLSNKHVILPAKETTSEEAPAAEAPVAAQTVPGQQKAV